MEANTATILSDPVMIRRKGIEALTSALGPEGMARFFQQYGLGSGNYTEERHAWLDDLSMDEVLEGARKIEQARQQNTPTT